MDPNEELYTEPMQRKLEESCLEDSKYPRYTIWGISALLLHVTLKRLLYVVPCTFMPSDTHGSTSIYVSCAVNQTCLVLFQVPRLIKNAASLVVTNIIYILIQFY